jgi:hypothetical protein
LVSRFKHKKIYHPQSLYDITKKKVREVYKNNWNETKVLPKTIQRELLLDWLRCDEKISESDDDVERIVARMERGWEALKPFGPTTFVYLMRLPDEVPPFAHERNHIIWDFYLWYEQGREKKICEPCYSGKSRFYRPGSANEWLEKGWVFKRVENHSMIDGDRLLENLIWDEDNWCSLCIVEPLWIHILDDDDCLFDYEYHLKRRRTWSHSSSEDSDIDYCKHTVMQGIRLNPTLYKFINE